VPVLREAWVQGIVDENTLVWGSGLIDWLPIRNVRTLVPQIRTVEGEQPHAAARRGRRDLARLQPRHAQGPRPACLRTARRTPRRRHRSPCLALPPPRDPAVQLATWVKKTFALKPALEKARKQRATHRGERTAQIDNMY
jgi:hypothetical protein